MADLRPVYVAGDGDVKGPASASNNFLPLFADTTGKLLKSSETGVTAQGLAILDDNTPTEQRNTIGLDQVNNTSDVNKPVSTAQQNAINTAVARYLLLTGGTIGGNLSVTGTTSVGGTLFANANFACAGSVVVTGNGQVAGSMTMNNGASVAGNLTVTGTTILKGGVEVYGVVPFLDFHANNTEADFSVRLLASGNSLILSTPDNSQVMTLSGGKVSITTPLTVSNTVTIGTAQFAVDGSVFGPAWVNPTNNALSTYIDHRIPDKIANMGVGAVGSYALMTNRAGVALYAGQLVPGASLTYTNTEDASRNGGAASGTWRCMGAVDSSPNDRGSTVFLRVT